MCQRGGDLLPEILRRESYLRLYQPLEKGGMYVAR